MLTDSAVKAAKPKAKPYHLTDGLGMYLLVKPNGGKYWRMDYSLHGRRKKYAVGVYPSVSLKDARIERDKAKRLVSEGIDPVQYRQMTKASQRKSSENSFETVALEWLAKQKQVWTEGHAVTVEQRLRKNLLPWLGNRPISEINPPELLRVLRRIEDRGAVESAYRSRTIAGQVFRYGIACGLCDRDPSADLRDALQPRKPKKMAAITEPAEVGGLMRAIDGYQGDLITRCALRLSALTFCRPGEIRHAEWAEIIWAKEEWVIPAEKMKMKRDHVIPLADQTIKVLQELHPATSRGKYVFPSLRTPTRCMSENTVNAALRRMGIPKTEMVAHGFRSMASTLLHENGFGHDVIELQLSHSRKDRIAAAYDRSERLPERRRMMQWWADYLDNLKTQGQEIPTTG
jgi:integrase